MTKNNSSGIFPDLIHEPEMIDNVKHLAKARAFVDKLSKTHDTTKIKIPNGVIITTCPEKWDGHLKSK